MQNVPNKDFIEYIFKGFIAVVMSLSIYIFSGFESSIDNIQKSVTKLNINFALFSERLITHKENYIQMEDRVRRLEEMSNKVISTRWSKQDHKEYAKEVKALLDELEGYIKNK